MLLRHLTYPNVIATLALLFAMTGGAYAAKHYIISSLKQISPKVLKELQGKQGPAGPGGAQGPAGPVGKEGPAGKEGPVGKEGAVGKEGPVGKEGKEGKEGKAGSPWTAGGTLPAGSTETGQWNFVGEDAAKTPESTEISFNVPLKAPLDEAHVHLIAAGETPPAGCSGTVAAPGAESGNLCVFTALLSELAPGLPGLFGTHNPIVDSSIAGLPAGAGATGAGLVFEVEKTGLFLGQGSWAVTG